MEDLVWQAHSAAFYGRQRPGVTRPITKPLATPIIAHPLYLIYTRCDLTISGAIVRFRAARQSRDVPGSTIGVGMCVYVYVLSGGGGGAFYLR